MVIFNLAVLFSVVAALSVIATPTEPKGLEQRLGGSFVVDVNGVHNYCMLMPAEPHTIVANSFPWSHCAGTKSASQMLMPSNFWSNVTFKSGNTSGRRFAQLTGCIRPRTLDRLIPTDPGGQYIGNTTDKTKCTGYKHFVEIVEPVKNRACIKCCDDPNDCKKSSKVHPQCPSVIPGKYFNCA